MLIDTHVHLNHPELYQKIDEVINDAILNNVNKFFVVGYDVDTSKQAVEIANNYDNCYAIVGFHPTEIKDYTDKEYILLESLLTNKKVVALGEVGFDFHWDVTSKEEQMIAFVRQIKLAIKYKLPLSIHSRDALQLTYDTLKEYSANLVGGVMHSYSGSSEMAKEFIKLGFKLGISGPVTFKNVRTMKEVVEKIDLKYLLTETDSPYLTPHPYRGKENGPKYIPLIASTIASIKGISLEEVEKRIEENVKELFGV